MSCYLPSTSCNIMLPNSSFVSFYHSLHFLTLPSDILPFPKHTSYRMVSGPSFHLPIMGSPCTDHLVPLFLNSSYPIWSLLKRRGKYLMLKTYPSRMDRKTSQRKCPRFPFLCLWGNTWCGSVSVLSHLVYTVCEREIWFLSLLLIVWVILDKLLNQMPEVLCGTRQQHK